MVGLRRVRALSVVMHSLKSQLPIQNIELYIYIYIGCRWNAFIFNKSDLSTSSLYLWYVEILLLLNSGVYGRACNFYSSNTNA